MLKTRIRQLRRVLATFLCLSALLVPLQSAAAQSPATRFEITFPASAHAQPITGRVYVMISRTNEREPRQQVGRTGIPFFGQDVTALKAGQAAVIDEATSASP